MAGAAPATTGPGAGSSSAAVDLLWIPLGAGGHFVRWNGQMFEYLAARREHRRRLALYHSALEIYADTDRWVIEMTPAWGSRQPARGVTAVGLVGSTRVGRLRAFQYEVRCWRNGIIPDAAWAAGGAQRISEDPRLARQILALVPQFPTHTWGRDEQSTGDMWNSNSLTAWLLASSGHDMSQVQAPARGRAPGWSAGVAVARALRRHEFIAARGSALL